MSILGVRFGTDFVYALSLARLKVRAQPVHRLRSKQKTTKCLAIIFISYRTAQQQTHMKCFQRLHIEDVMHKSPSLQKTRPCLGVAFAFQTIFFGVGTPKCAMEDILLKEVAERKREREKNAGIRLKDAIQNYPVPGKVQHSGGYFLACTGINYAGCDPMCSLSKRRGSHMK